MRKILILLVAILSIFTLTSCMENFGTNVLDMVSFKDATFEYDGSKHSIYVENLPEGYTVQYTGNDVTEVGTYEVTAGIFKDEVIVLTLKATITITGKSSIEVPEELKGVLFNDVRVAHTGKEYSIFVENLPVGYTVAYSGNKVSEVGAHEVTAKIYNSDYKLVLTLKATITISNKTNVELPLV